MLAPVSDALAAEGAKSIFQDFRAVLLTLCSGSGLQSIPDSAMLLMQMRLDLSMIRRPESTEHAVIHKCLEAGLACLFAQFIVLSVHAS